MHGRAGKAELDRLDREWVEKRESLSSRWTGFASRIAPQSFVLFGLFVIGLSLFGIARGIRMSNAHEKAHQEYELERQELLARFK